MKKIALFTSGGDSPGMNACIRAVVRAGIYNKLEVVGIMHGYEGMIEGKFIPMDSGSVSGIIQRGGTILKTARSKRFMTKEGMKQAFQSLKNENIEGVVAIVQPSGHLDDRMSTVEDETRYWLDQSARAVTQPSISTRVRSILVAHAHGRFAT